MNPLSFLLVFLKASLFSTSALGNIPSLHHDLLTNGWASDTEFGEALSIGQISPGSNGLWVISIGYLTYGWLGTLLALVSITIPPFLILPLAAVYGRIEHQPWAQALIRSLSLASIGFLLSGAWSILDGRITDWSGLLICFAACILCFNRRFGTFPVLVAAAITGYLLYGWR
jgi:chromate transporter